MWNVFAAHGFTPQTIIDAAIAFPTWWAKYETEFNSHQDDGRAISAADTAVAESVGSGSDLHLGTWFNSKNPEIVKTMTVFGSWFNAYYQRMYRDTKGFTSMSPAAAHTILTLPLIVATLSAILIMDIPDDDDDDAWGKWLAKNYFSFVGGTAPLFRDFVSYGATGFAPSDPIAGGVKALWGITGGLPKQLMRYYEGEQTGLKTVNNIAKGLTTILPVPGAGQVTRAVDYVDSWNQGNEGNFDAYQMLVEGKDRNK